MHEGGTATLTFDLNEVHNISVDVLQRMEASNMEVSTAVLALILSLGRLLTPKPISDEEEVAFIQAVIEWAGVYFHEGSVN